MPTRPRLAAEALAGGLPRSSVGGEQPKFTATVQKHDGPHSIIVKFSPPLSTPEGERWADLLAAEAMASSVLADAGFHAPEIEWLDNAGRRFLKVTRFDRTQNGGRIPFVSLSAHDAAFFGEMNTPWRSASFIASTGVVPIIPIIGIPSIVVAGGRDPPG